jgi:Lrp/AsnC family transcriptional regulator, leucine-responsive regulatory protein
MACFYLTGDFDFPLKITGRDMDKYNGFLIHKLATLANIGTALTIFELSEGKVEMAYASGAGRGGDE